MNPSRNGSGHTQWPLAETTAEELVFVPLDPRSAAGSDQVGAGSMSAFLRICQIVDGAMVWPSPSSSPWMRRLPQVGFSAARRSASRRSSTAADGRLGGRCGWVQCRAMRRWCQRNSVSGVTSHPARLGRGSDRCEQAPVGVGELGAVDLSAQDCELVAQHDDLEALRAS